MKETINFGMSLVFQYVSSLLFQIYQILLKLCSPDSGSQRRLRKLKSGISKETKTIFKLQLK